MKYRQAKKIIKKYAGHFEQEWFSPLADWIWIGIPHGLKQKHVVRFFEGV